MDLLKMIALSDDCPVIAAFALLQKTKDSPISPVKI